MLEEGKISILELELQARTFILEPNGDSRVRKFGFIGEKKISGELTIRRE